MAFVNISDELTDTTRKQIASKGNVVNTIIKYNEKLGDFLESEDVAPGAKLLRANIYTSSDFDVNNSSPSNTYLLTEKQIRDLIEASETKIYNIIGSKYVLFNQTTNLIYKENATGFLKIQPDITYANNRNFNVKYKRNESGDYEEFVDNTIYVEDSGDNIGIGTNKSKTFYFEFYDSTTGNKLLETQQTFTALSPYSKLEFSEINNNSINVTYTKRLYNPPSNPTIEVLYSDTSIYSTSNQTINNLNSIYNKIPTVSGEEQTLTLKAIGANGLYATKEIQAKPLIATANTYYGNILNLTFNREITSKDGFYVEIWDTQNTESYLDNLPITGDPSNAFSKTFIVGDEGTTYNIKLYQNTTLILEYTLT